MSLSYSSRPDFKLNGQNILSYAWNPTTAMNPAAGNVAAVSVAPTTTTPYKVVVTNQFNCMDSSTRTVTVNPLPNASISGTTTICQNATAPDVTFTGATGTAPYTLYL